jgi:Invasion associated locus B (IalB) protein
MRQSLRWVVIALAVLAVAPQAGHAQTASAVPKQVSAHRDWWVYEVTDNRGRFCYLASEPTAQSGNYSRRDQPAALIVRLPGQSGEYLTIHPGYAYRKDSRVKVTFDGRPFDLFTDGEDAFSYNADDEAIIAAMKRGSSMTVRGTSTRGTYSLDTYSLSGFTAAYEAMRGSCLR